MDAACQHGLSAFLRERFAGRLHEALQAGAVDGQYQAGVGAKLASAHGQRIGKTLANGLSAPGQRCREQEYRIDAAHLRVHRNRLGTAVGNGNQRQATLPRSGEPHRLDRRVRHERLAQGATGTHQQREHSLGQTLVAHGLLDRTPHQFGGAEMGAVRFHDHRRTSCQGRSGIAPCHGKGEREIAGPEDGYRA